MILTMKAISLGFDMDRAHEEKEASEAAASPKEEDTPAADESGSNKSREVFCSSVSHLNQTYNLCSAILAYSDHSFFPVCGSFHFKPVFICVHSENADKNWLEMKGTTYREERIL